MHRQSDKVKLAADRFLYRASIYIAISFIAMQLVPFSIYSYFTLRSVHDYTGNPINKSTLEVLTLSVSIDLLIELIDQLIDWSDI